MVFQVLNFQSKPGEKSRKVFLRRLRLLKEMVCLPRPPWRSYNFVGFTSRTSDKYAHCISKGWSKNLGCRNTIMTYRLETSADRRKTSERIFWWSQSVGYFLWKNSFLDIYWKLTEIASTSNNVDNWVVKNFDPYMIYIVKLQNVGSRLIYEDRGQCQRDRNTS